MQSHVASFVTPLSISEKHGYGSAWGTGTYISGAENPWILTAQHVIKDIPDGALLAYLPSPDGEYCAALSNSVEAPWPVDAAALPLVMEEFWPTKDRILPIERIDKSFQAHSNEVLFFMGFPGYRSDRNDPRMPSKLRTSMFNELYTPMKPMLSQMYRSGLVNNSNFNGQLHIPVLYPDYAQRESDGQTVPLPNPAGMSGSALWDTKYVACLEEGKSWDPSMAVICGVVWAVLDEPKVVIATKIEVIRQSLEQIFRG